MKLAIVKAYSLDMDQVGFPKLEMVHLHKVGAITRKFQFSILLAVKIANPEVPSQTKSTQTARFTCFASELASRKGIGGYLS